MRSSIMEMSEGKKVLRTAKGKRRRKRKARRKMSMQNTAKKTEQTNETVNDGVSVLATTMPPLSGEKTLLETPGGIADYDVYEVY